MEVFDFAAEVIGISASGVLAPGPLFFANLLYGSRQGSGAGLKIAYGHTIVELPLVILLVAGVFSASAFLSSYIDVIGIIGGTAILGFAGLQIFSASRMRSKSQPPTESSRGPFLAGIALSALNPFFIIWWLTAGLKLAADATAFGVVGGIALLFGMHIWMDYAWLISTAYLSSKGITTIGSRYYSLIVFALTGVLIYFGVSILIASSS